MFLFDSAEHAATRPIAGAGAPTARLILIGQKERAPSRTQSMRISRHIAGGTRAPKSLEAGQLVATDAAAKAQLLLNDDALSSPADTPY